ncbi:MAG: hypothetical protein EA364_16060 [Balneolaceae bacterium]|nr:MAG: hypothetical protein EA364_16060 [Balneolaceae bacterium]
MPSFCRKYPFLFMLLLFPVVVHPQIPQHAVPPAEAARLYEQALELYRQGELDSAVTRLRALTGSWPNLEEPWTLLSVALLQSEDFDGAEEAVRAGLEYMPESVGLLQVDAEVHVARGYLQEGLRRYADLEQAARSDQELPRVQRTEILNRLAELHLLTGFHEVERERYNRAGTHFEEVVRLQPDSVYGYQNLAVVYFRTDRFRDASAVIDRGLNRNPLSVTLLRMKVAALSGLEEYTELENIYSILQTLEPDDSVVTAGYLQVLLINRKFDEAGAFVESVLARSPDNYDLYTELSDTYSRTGYLVGAVGILQRRLLRDPGHRPTLLKKAAMLEQLGEYEEAARIYISISGEDSPDQKGGLGLARMYARIDSVDAAQEVWQSLTEAFESDEAIVLEASQFFLDRGNGDRAIALLEQLNRSRPGPANRFELGRAIDRVYGEHRAIEHYASAVDDGFFHPLAFYRLATAGYSIDGAGQGCELLRRTLDLTLVRLNALQRQVLSTLGEEGTGGGNLLRQPGEPGLAESDSMAMLTYETLADRCQADFSREVLFDLLDRYGDSGNIRLLAARFFRNSGDNAKALEQASLAANLNPRMFDAHLLEAKLAEQMNQTERALQSYERARSLNPGIVEPWDSLIRLHRRRQTLDGLCDHWLVLYRLEPDNQLLREKLTEALHRAGRYEEVLRLKQEKKPE